MLELQDSIIHYFKQKLFINEVLYFTLESHFIKYLITKSNSALIISYSHCFEETTIYLVYQGLSVSAVYQVCLIVIVFINSSLNHFSKSVTMCIMNFSVVPNYDL